MISFFLSLSRSVVVVNCVYCYVTELTMRRCSPSHVSASSSPTRERVFGVPHWLSPRQSGRFVYSRLTFWGARQLESGVKGGMPSFDYLGDVLVRPPPFSSYEIPLLGIGLVRFSRLVNKIVFGSVVGVSSSSVPPAFRFDFRFMADARNLLFTLLVLSVLDLALLESSIALLSPLVAVYVICGAVVFRVS